MKTEKEIINYINTVFSEENNKKYNTLSIKVANIEDNNAVKKLNIPNNILENYLLCYSLNSNLKYIVWYKEEFEHMLLSKNDLIKSIHDYIVTNYVYMQNGIDDYINYASSIDVELTEEIFSELCFRSLEDERLDSFIRFINEVFMLGNVKNYGLPFIHIDLDFNTITYDDDYVISGKLHGKHIIEIVTEYIKEQDKFGKISNIFIDNPDLHNHVICTNPAWAEFLFRERFNYWLNKRGEREEEIHKLINNNSFYGGYNSIKDKGSWIFNEMFDRLSKDVVKMINETDIQPYKLTSDDVYINIYDKLLDSINRVIKEELGEEKLFL